MKQNINKGIAYYFFYIFFKDSFPHLIKDSDST